MEIRAIRPEEYAAAENIMALCFRYERTEDPVNDTGTRHHNIYGLFEDGGRLTSVIVGNAYRALYWGSPVGMCGVGGVTTLPEARRGGQITQLMRFTLEEAYRRGDLLAALYPFSHPFYRRYGFENGGALYTVKARNEAFASFAPTGRTRRYTPGADDASIRAIYEAFAAGRNLCCERSDGMWKHRLGGDVYRTHTATYLWQSDAGADEAYLTVRHEREDGKNFFRVLDWAYLGRGGLMGVLGFLRLLAPDGERIELTLPGGVNPFLLFPEPYAVEVRAEAQGMLRAVNVQACLERYPWQEGESFVVRVSDPVLDVNNASFAVRRRDGHTAVERTDAPCDLDMSIQALSLLVLGAADLPELLFHRADCRALTDRRPACRRNPIQLQENF